MYLNKYLKYKKKYLNERNQIGGANAPNNYVTSNYSSWVQYNMATNLSQNFDFPALSKHFNIGKSLKFYLESNAGYNKKGIEVETKVIENISFESNINNYWTVRVHFNDRFIMTITCIIDEKYRPNKLNELALNPDNNFANNWYIHSPFNILFIVDENNKDIFENRKLFDRNRQFINERYFG